MSGSLSFKPLESRQLTLPDISNPSASHQRDKVKYSKPQGAASAPVSPKSTSSPPQSAQPRSLDGRCSIYGGMGHVTCAIPEGARMAAARNQTFEIPSLKGPALSQPAQSIGSTAKAVSSSVSSPSISSCSLSSASQTLTKATRTASTNPSFQGASLNPPKKSFAPIPEAPQMHPSISDDLVDQAIEKMDQLETQLKTDEEWLSDMSWRKLYSRFRQTSLEEEKSALTQEQLSIPMDLKPDECFKRIQQKEREVSQAYAEKNYQKADVLCKQAAHLGSAKAYFSLGKNCFSDIRDLRRFQPILALDQERGKLQDLILKRLTQGILFYVQPMRYQELSSVEKGLERKVALDKNERETQLDLARKELERELSAFKRYVMQEFPQLKDELFLSKIEGLIQSVKAS